MSKRSPSSSRSSSRSSTRSSTNTRRSSSRAPSAPASSTSPDTSDPIHEADDSGADWDVFAARGRATKRKADPATVATGAPWVKNGIDYGPARAAFKDLAVWALDLVEREVADEPADTRRIRSVRRSLLGTASREPSARDVMFTAQILARVLDRDLALGLADQLAIFEQLDLSTDVLPMWSPTPRASTPLEGRTPTRIPASAPAERPIATVRIRFETMPTVQLDAPTPPPLRFCDECALVHERGDHVRYRNAA